MIYDFDPEIMRNVYYSLSLPQKKYKKFKTVTILYQDLNLTDLNRLLNETLKNLRIIKNRPWNKSLKILQLLNEIIPNEYFGTTNHRKLFYEVVKLILTQSAQECIYFSTITYGYTYQTMSWLDCTKDRETCKNLLKRANFFLLEVVVKPLVTFYYKPIKTYVGHEIQFIPLNEWKRFENKLYGELLKSRFLIEIKQTKEIKPRGCLKFIPKGKLEELKFRPIVTCYKRAARDKFYHRQITQKIRKATRNANIHFSPSLYKDWLRFVDNTTETTFGIKLDIADAFGSIDIPNLLQMVLNIKGLTEIEKTFLKNHIENQYVLFHNKIYKWEHGLLQGDYLSAILCDFYMTEYDKTRIPLKTDFTFIFRTVDDYFFCSVKPRDVEHFRYYIPLIHKINESKTISNLVTSTQRIPFCGLLFNLETLEAKNFFHFKKGYEIRHKFKLWNIRQPIPETDYSKFLQKAVSISFSSTYLNKIQLNTNFNTQKTVLENFFEAMIFVGYKFDAAVIALRHNYLIQDFNFVYEVFKDCVKLYSVKMRRRIHLNVGENYDSHISVNLLMNLAVKAFLLVFKRRNEIYKNFILRIKKDFHLHFQFKIPGVDPNYFNKIPVEFQDVKISRKVLI